MLSGEVGAPHSGQSTDSRACARASLISFDRSSWMVWSPRQGHPRCASAQRPGHVATGCLLGDGVFLLTLLTSTTPDVPRNGGPGTGTCSGRRGGGGWGRRVVGNVPLPHRRRHGRG